MKHVSRFSVPQFLAVIIIILSITCTGCLEGDKGPPGPQGPQGPQGIEGPPGTLLNGELRGVVTLIEGYSGVPAFDASGVNVSIEELAKRISRQSKYNWVTLEHLILIAENDPKGRFEIEGKKIRSRYGHSLKKPINVESETLKEFSSFLWHGTPRRNIESILSSGLLPMKRQMVHLTSNREEAIKTGLRHGKDIVLIRINYQRLLELNIPFQKVGKTIYAIKEVPPYLITIESL